MNDSTHVITSIIAVVIVLAIINFIIDSDKTPALICREPGCNRERALGNDYCYIHKKHTVVSNTKSYSNNSGVKIPSAKSITPVETKTSTTNKTTKKTYDSYNVQNYKSAQDFADDKFEEFYDYEDDYEDEDEAYDAAEDYWREHHKK